MNNKQLFFLLKLETSFRQSYFHTTTRDSLHITSCLWSRILTRHARQIFQTSVLASSSILLPKLLTSDAFIFFKGWNPPLPPPPPLKNTARNSNLCHLIQIKTSLLLIINCWNLIGKGKLYTEPLNLFL